MNYYNKYRPSKFGEVAQSHITRVLQAQILQKLHVTTYLFAGPSGTGKTTVARIFAMALVCENLSDSGEPCGECDSCVHTRERRNRDVMEENAADHNGVDDVRDLIANRMRIQPVRGDKRIFIIDEMHMYTPQAQDALLKILEEPPPYVTFILCTTDPQKIKPTLRGRCQPHLFRRVPDVATRTILQKVVKLELLDATDAGLDLIVQSANGSARVALQILEHVSLVGVTEENVLEMLGRAPREMAIKLLLAIGNLDNLAAYQVIETAKIESRDLCALSEEAARFLMESVVPLKLLSIIKSDSPEYDDAQEKIKQAGPTVKKIARLYPGVQLIEATQQLLDITKNVRQNVPADTQMKVSVLRLIDKFAKLKENKTS